MIFSFRHPRWTWILHLSFFTQHLFVFNLFIYLAALCLYYFMSLPSPHSHEVGKYCCSPCCQRDAVSPLHRWELDAMPIGTGTWSWGRQLRAGCLLSKARSDVLAPSISCCIYLKINKQRPPGLLPLPSLEYKDKPRTRLFFFLSSWREKGAGPAPSTVYWFAEGLGRSVSSWDKEHGRAVLVFPLDNIRHFLWQQLQDLQVGNQMKEVFAYQQSFREWKIPRQSTFYYGQRKQQLYRHQQSQNVNLFILRTLPPMTKVMKNIDIFQNCPSFSEVLRAPITTEWLPWFTLELAPFQWWVKWLL